MEKEFIPYEQALALKELGFDEPCFGKYLSSLQSDWKDFELTLEMGINEEFEDNRNIYLFEGACSAPTFSQAFKFFREKHNLFYEIQIDRTTEPKFCFDIFQYEHFGNYEEIRIGEWYLYRTQEEAELECLKELIEIVKRK